MNVFILAPSNGNLCSIVKTLNYKLKQLFKVLYKNKYFFKIVEEFSFSKDVGLQT